MQVFQKNCLAKTQGSLMIEFLLSLAIFSICIAGLAVVQVNSVRVLVNQKDAMANGFILEDIIARVSANRKNLDEYFGNASNASNATIAENDLSEINENAKLFNREVQYGKGIGVDTITITIKESEPFDINNVDILKYTMQFQDEGALLQFPED